MANELSIPVVIGLDVLHALLRIGAKAHLSNTHDDHELKAMYVIACNAQQQAEHPITEERWQYSDRSSLTSTLISLLNQCPVERERHAIIADLAEHLRS